jgi:hypothetical protein
MVVGWLHESFAGAPGGSTTPVVVVTPWAPSETTLVTDSKQPEPKFDGLPVSQWIQTKTALNPGHLELGKMMALKWVSGPDEWGIAKFEVPVSYDAMKSNAAGGLSIGSLDSDGNFVPCCFEGCDRATNGHCLMWWTINYDAPGRHRLRAQMEYYSNLNHIEVIGPPLVYYSSNVCQFIEGTSLWDDTGANLEARLREPKASYRIELKTVEGKHLKTITGNSTNGFIDREWNLISDRGEKLKGHSFDAFFYVTYPGDAHTNPPARDQYNKIGGG